MPRKNLKLVEVSLPQMEHAVNDEELRKAGLKVTIPRMRILQLLEHNASEHFRAEDIYRSLVDSGDDIGLATVYRVLTQFEAAGLVTRHYFESGQSVFELNQGEHHDHLVCVQCGRVDEFVDEVIEQRQQHIAERSNYDMTDHSLYIYGICPGCKKSSALK